MNGADLHGALAVPAPRGEMFSVPLGSRHADETVHVPTRFPPQAVTLETLEQVVPLAPPVELDALPVPAPDEAPVLDPVFVLDDPPKLGPEMPESVSLEVLELYVAQEMAAAPKTLPTVMRVWMCVWCFFMGELPGCFLLVARRP